MIDDLQKEVESIRKFEDEKSYIFIRTNNGSFKGKLSYSTWKVLIDESKSVSAVRDSRGFSTKPKTLSDQRVIANEGVKNLILSKFMADKEVGRAILDQLAEEKYR